MLEVLAYTIHKSLDIEVQCRLAYNDLAYSSLLPNHKLLAMFGYFLLLCQIEL